VREKYLAWQERFPTVQSLAEAPLSEVLALWQGLGYNRRALNLQRAAMLIAADYDGDVLKALAEHERLPGIGPYTARAVRIFSANEDIVTVDTNIRRILLYEFSLPEPTADKDLWQLAERCLPRGRSRDWHNALMDYGAMVLTSHTTGIRPRTRQSRFEGSERQVRGQVLRLLSQGPRSMRQLQSLITDPRLSRVIHALEKEGFLARDKERVRIR
jgi:A/G-specific adenine glycosylase